MTQLTPQQARVIDPVLSTYARGYRQSELVASALFPFADQNLYGGNCIEFGKESFRIYNSKRAPGSATKRVTFGYLGKPFAIQPRALEAVVPVEWMRDAAAVPGINLATRALNTVLRSQLLEYEVDAAAIATNAGNYDNEHKITLASGSVWDDPDSDPASDIETGKEAIRDTVGAYPNTLLLSAKAIRSCRKHPKLIDRSANSGIRKVTLALLQEIFEVDKIVIGGGVMASGQNDAFSDVWGHAAILAYVSPGADVNANIEEPSYGYGYRIEGMPHVAQPYFEQNANSWIYPVQNDSTPVLTGMQAGYLITNAGAPAA